MEHEAERNRYDVMFSEARFSVVAILEQARNLESSEVEKLGSA